MSRIRVACLVFALPSAFASLAYLSNSVGVPVRAAPKTDPDFPEVREIELAAIYSTSGQKKLEGVYRHIPEKSPELEAFVSINDMLQEGKSPPRLAVVRGEDIREAVLATGRFLKLKDPPARPVGPDDKSACKKCWLFVYLGHAQAKPHNWLIFPPTVFGTRVRLMYTSFEGWHSDEPIGEAVGYGAYMYWVALGDVADPSELKAELVELSKTVKGAYPAKSKR